MPQPSTARGSAHADDVVAILADLIRIDSANPDLVPGASGESRIADHLGDWLERRGFECRRLEGVPGRPSILAVSHGTGGGRSLMLNGHIDTVALSSYDGDPLDPVIRDGNLYGRGAYDMKSGVAAIIVAAAAATTTPHRGDIVLALVADEEWASAGTEEVLQQVITDGAIVVEPSGLDLVIAHRGFVWADVTIHGVSAHGSRPDLGVDAITKAGKFLVAIDELGTSLANGPSHATLSTGSVHASTIIGGTEASTYPDECRVLLERRTIPGEDPAFVENELRTILDGIAADDPDFRYDLAIGTHRPPFQAATDSTIAETVTKHFGSLTGGAPRRRGEPFWTDCALLAEAGTDTVLIGVDGGGAHAATEWVDLASLEILTRALEATIRDYVNT